MDAGDSLAGAPSVEQLRPVFHVYQVRRDGDRLLYVGDPRTTPDAIERRLWEPFHDAGYELSLERDYDPESDVQIPTHGWVLVARPRTPGIDGVPWTNVVLLLLTIGSTLLVGGVQWYRIDPTGNPLALLRAWPFVAAVLGVLAVHELGHYVASRYHGVEASLPYFIPFPTLIGTMGAVIRMKGRIPNRKALFDIGASGPLAGLVATVVVSAIGLQLDPLAVQQGTPEPGATIVEFNFPLLLQGIAAATGTSAKLAEGAYHPVVFGGWVGMFITVLNLLPVGQLDGGHIARSVFGERQETVAAAVPAALFGLAGYLYFVSDVTNAVGVWVMWGLLATGLAYAGPATPIRDTPLDDKRVALAILTFVLGILCFTPIPFELGAQV
ncbi:Peptidase family M50 [Halomicrobium zhouii]|uniref:Peptidase family M50 n=1 Tax=Halomicrobium zhouii TaxID=767519 RepID=A0A1I6KFI1_9EURY|nr:site-2 protease family protein [Halomicrobium zhouii]SFR89798.1 Peptidase family M50 [Halomicrobium zhouii]